MFASYVVEGLDALALIALARLLAGGDVEVGERRLDQQRVGELEPDLVQAAADGPYRHPKDRRDLLMPPLGERFADLVIAQELTDVFHDYDEQTGLTDFPPPVGRRAVRQRRHARIHRRERTRPAPRAGDLCQLTWQAPAAGLPVRQLDRIEQSLAAGPLNYVWFQLRLLVIAKTIWQADGATALRAFHNSLRQPTEIASPPRTARSLKLQRSTTE